MNPESDGYKLVYQGGHHNVYCDGKKHIWTSGGKCWPDLIPVEKRRGDCDCKQWKELGKQ